jgi:HD-GYP domain-containing protein (c-di-GMP phosphodiesterase class II)
MINIKGFFGTIPWFDHTFGAEPVHKTLAGPPSSFTMGRNTASFIQESIHSLLRTLTARDPYTGHHSARVTDVSLGFGKYLGLTSQELDSLKIAGYLHDIGKIGVRDTILLKPGPLSHEERAIIETHPLIGEKIVEPLGLLPQEKQIILHHHERWNGEGYPDRLAGEAIPPLCRLAALVDVFDALITDRPYRPRFTVPEALMEIESQSGVLFDPHLAQKFLKFIASRPTYSNLTF